jgi:hypothetical protein
MLTHMMLTNESKEETAWQPVGEKTLKASRSTAKRKGLAFILELYK